MSSLRQCFLILAVCCILTVAAWPQFAHAHRSGCHNLHTCPSDTNSYVCGDLGYPCNGAVSIKDIAPATIFVPLVVEKAFAETFGRTPTDIESAYWKNRFREDKDGLYKIRRTMEWHKANGSYGPTIAATASTVSLTKNINALFRTVYDGRNPTPSENLYWLSRVKDKPSEPAMIGAMTYHKAHGIQH